MAVPGNMFVQLIFTTVVMASPAIVVADVIRMEVKGMQQDNREPKAENETDEREGE